MDKELMQFSRRRGRQSAANRAPIAVITVPTMLPPTYVVPVEFSVTATGPVLLPSPLNLATVPIRLSSIRCTAVGTGVGTVRLQFTAPQETNLAPLNRVTRTSRVIPVGTSAVELVMRNDKRVPHLSFGGTVLTPSLLTINISGTVTVTGVYFVTVLAPFP